MSERRPYTDVALPDEAAPLPTRVDLSLLADEDYYPQEEWGGISLRGLHGFWYKLTPLERTELRGENISPVRLDIRKPVRSSGSSLETAAIGLQSAKNWLTEFRHFSSDGVVSVRNQIVEPGDRLVIDGHSTSPIDAAWVTQDIVVHLGDDDSSEWTTSKHLAHFAPTL